ncbi:MAG: N-acetylmuramoyl-L-alanine amidase, partial [Acidobacteriota bacterium]
MTWHWTATADLAECTRLIGGADAERRGIASAHYAVGRDFAEGVDQYVSLDDRSWHAGRNQTLRYDGHAFSCDDDKGARTSIGIETVHLGYARDGVPVGSDGVVADTVDGGRRLRMAPWGDEQIEMMVAVGRDVIARWPHIGPRDHHGHHDLCPGYKVDVAGFPFARVLSGIYDRPVADVWSSTWTVQGRRFALRRLGFSVASMDGFWTRLDDLALRRFQHRVGLPANGFFTTAVAWALYDVYRT